MVTHLRLILNPDVSLVVVSFRPGVVVFEKGSMIGTNDSWNFSNLSSNDKNVSSRDVWPLEFGEKELLSISVESLEKWSREFAAPSKLL